MSKKGKIGKIEKLETVSPASKVLSRVYDSDESDNEIELKPTINHVSNSDDEAVYKEPPKKDRKKYTMTEENRLLKVESMKACHYKKMANVQLRKEQKQAMQDAEEDEILKRVSAKLLKDKKMRVKKVYNEVIQDNVKLIQESSDEEEKEDSTESEPEPEPKNDRRKKVINQIKPRKPKKVIKNQYLEEEQEYQQEQEPEPQYYPAPYRRPLIFF